MIRSGFFNSLVNDKRKYYNADISRLFNALIIDGVFQNVGNQLMVEAGTGMSVNVQSGLAYFNSTWLFNDSDYVITINDAPIVEGYSRIDGIFLKMLDENNFGDRENSIYYMVGQAGSQPTRPVPTVEDKEVYIPLCYITVTANLSAITQANITNCVGVTTTTPFVSGILKTIEATKLLAQWEAIWNEWLEDKTEDWDDWFYNTTTNDGAMWNTWFDSVKEDLATVEVGGLKNKVDAITGMYVQNSTLFLPNTAASVTSDGKLILGLPVE